MTYHESSSRGKPETQAERELIGREDEKPRVITRIKKGKETPIDEKLLF